LSVSPLAFKTEITELTILARAEIALSTVSPLTLTVALSTALSGAASIVADPYTVIV
jgi:hypothetical protein